jgi:spore germination protein KC
LSGCWDYKEINEIAIVSGMAVDRDKDSGDFIVTVEIVNAQQGGSKEQGGFSAEIYNGQGKTMFDAIRNMILKIGRRLYWAHAKVGIISEDIAREGIIGVLDWIERDPEVRSNMRLFISKGKEAGEIFYSYCPIESTISFQLEKIIESTDNVEKVPDTDTWRFTNDMSSEGISAVIPVVYLVNSKDAAIPQVYGTAVFKRDKLVGYLDGNETQAFLMVRNEVKGGIIPIKNAAGSKDDVSLEIFGAKSEVKPVYKDGKVKMNIKVEIDVSIAEIEGTVNVIQDEGQVELKEQAEKHVKSDIEGVIEKVQQEYHSDIFGFGKTINRKLPGYWKEVNDNWEEEFSILDTEVDVKINIIGSATTSEPLKIGD